MSLKLALRTLKRLGLTGMDAQVYVYLAKKGPQGQNDLATGLRLAEFQLCPILQALLARGMVKAVSENSGTYLAVPLEKILDDFVNAAKEHARVLQASREELLSSRRLSGEKHNSNA